MVTTKLFAFSCRRSVCLLLYKCKTCRKYAYCFVLSRWKVLILNLPGAAIFASFVGPLTAMVVASAGASSSLPFKRELKTRTHFLKFLDPLSKPPTPPPPPPLPPHTHIPHPTTLHTHRVVLYPSSVSPQDTFYLCLILVSMYSFMSPSCSANTLWKVFMGAPQNR